MIEKEQWPKFIFIMVFAGSIIYGQNIQAERGDTLIVTGQDVNLRAEPFITAKIIKRLAKNIEVIEISRFDEWVEITSNHTYLDYGWVHQDYLATVDGESLSTRQNSQFDLFKTRLIAYTNSLETEHGFGVFTHVELVDAGTIKLTASTHWFNLDQTHREQILSEVFDLWGKYLEIGKSALVEVVDSESQRHMMMFK